MGEPKRLAILTGLVVFVILAADTKADGLPPLSDRPDLNPNQVTESFPGQLIDEGSALDIQPGAIKTPERPSASLERANQEALSAAVGHYARARSLLIAAIREFDDGYKIAKPDAILNSKLWRESVISRAEELEKILAPQPRITKTGVKFRGDNRLLQTEAKGK